MIDMAYHVMSYFKDTLDGGFVYHVGDQYPRHGYEPTQERIRELSTNENIRKKPLIKKIQQKKKKEKEEKEENK